MSPWDKMLRFFLVQSLLATTSCIEQIHLGFASLASSMLVEFVSSGSVSHTVTYSPNSEDNRQRMVSSSVTSRISGIGFLHRAEMTDLEPNTRYFYGIEEPDSNNRAGPYSFVASPEREGGSTVAFLADFGYENAESLPQLIDDVANGAYDAVIHGGDIAYDLFEQDGEQGNLYMRAVQPFTARVPYMVAVGNHEHNDNFLQYLTRFDGMRAGAGAASGSGTAFYYSFDLGLVHYVAVSTEVYAYEAQTRESLSPITREEQNAWLVRDLTAANANRDAVPWVVVYGHKGWYMDYFVTSTARYFQVDFTDFAQIFDDYNVDLYLSGHNHLYQRFLPLSAPTELGFRVPAKDVDSDCASGVVGDNTSQVYTNPKYTTHIVVGSPGNREWTREGDCAAGILEWPQLQNTMAECIDGYGFGQLRAPNRTHLQWTWKMTAPPNIRDLRKWGLERLRDAIAHRTTPPPPKADVPYKSDELWIVRTDSGSRMRAGKSQSRQHRREGDGGSSSDSADTLTGDGIDDFDASATPSAATPRAPRRAGHGCGRSDALRVMGSLISGVGMAARGVVDAIVTSLIS